MTRKRDRFWECAEQLGNRFRCKFCEQNFAGGILKIKSHLAGIQDGDVPPCTNVPEPVRAMASAAITPQKEKKPKSLSPLMASTPLADIQKIDMSETSKKKGQDWKDELLANHVPGSSNQADIRGEWFTEPNLPALKDKAFGLHFTTSMPLHFFTEEKIQGDQGTAIGVALLSLETGYVVQSGPASAAKLNLVILGGCDIGELDPTWDQLESHIIPRGSEEGKAILSGDLVVNLKGGMGTLGDISFTQDSSRTSSGKYRLGVKVACRCHAVEHIHGAVSEAFVVENSHGEFVKKHFPLLPRDYVWRVVGVAMGRQAHKRLTGAEIVIVQDFVDLLSVDEAGLRNILGSGISDAMWKHTVAHAMSRVSDDENKDYVYYFDEGQTNGILFNWNFEPKGLIRNGLIQRMESLSGGLKAYLKSQSKIAYENPDQISEYQPHTLHSDGHSTLLDWPAWCRE
ncbi:hypothetical protein BT93_K1446 [Corymbia citriodora subsp. variegata]|nr:hypothetical protein BT93_K1446 [Corymbia citriodora subsp. variegata]